jgi:hypothetical protein
VGCGARERRLSSLAPHPTYRNLGGASSCLICLLTATFLPHRLALQFNPMGVVDETIEDAIGNGWISDLGMPGGNWQLAGQHRRSCLIARVANFQKVASLEFGHRHHGPIIDNQQIDAPEPVEQFGMAAIRACRGEVAKQFRRVL